MSDKKLPTINRVFIAGNLTRDPELRKTGTGTPVVNFRIAANRRFKDAAGNRKEEVCYVGVVAWQRLAEACGDYLRKGSAVFVEGELQSRNWETDDGSKRSTVEIHAHRVQFLDRKPEDNKEEEYEEERFGAGPQQDWSADETELKGA